MRSGPRCNSPTYLAGCGTPTAARSSTRPGWPGGCGRPAWRPACGSTRTRRSGRDRRRSPVRQALTLTHAGRVRSRARQVALATGAFSPLLRRLRYYLIPVYDYVLMTEPLSAAQLASIGWQRRQGVGDSANQFHYYRLTARQPDPVGRVRRDLLLRQQDHRGAGPAAGHVRQAGPALLRDVPAAGGAVVQPQVGRRHRHLLAVLRLLRHRARRAAGLRGGLHRARRRRQPVRRPGPARPARRRSPRS